MKFPSALKKPYRAAGFTVIQLKFKICLLRFYY
jgi:hypothetical protein